MASRRRSKPSPPSFSDRASEFLETIRKEQRKLSYGAKLLLFSVASRLKAEKPSLKEEEYKALVTTVSGGVKVSIRNGEPIEFGSVFSLVTVLPSLIKRYNVVLNDGKQNRYIEREKVIRELKGLADAFKYAYESLKVIAESKYLTEAQRMVYELKMQLCEKDLNDVQEVLKFLGER
jgi:hypothetical protein